MTVAPHVPHRQLKVGRIIISINLMRKNAPYEYEYE